MPVLLSAGAGGGHTMGGVGGRLRRGDAAPYIYEAYKDPRLRGPWVHPKSDCYYG